MRAWVPAGVMVMGVVLGLGACGEEFEPGPPSGGAGGQAGQGGEAGTAGSTSTGGEGGSLLPNGAQCQLPSECESDWCIDGVCCEDECAHTCGQCDQEGHEGECRPAAPATDPRDDCGDGVCDGQQA